MMRNTERRKNIGYRSIDRAVASMQARNIDAYWDGWVLKIFMPSHSAYTNPKGVFRNGRWGFVRSIRVRNDGKWSVPSRYL